MTKAVSYLLSHYRPEISGIGVFLFAGGVWCSFFFPSPKIMTEMQNEKANHHTSSATLESF